jgi:hypothetical protein
LVLTIRQAHLVGERQSVARVKPAQPISLSLLAPTSHVSPAAGGCVACVYKRLSAFLRAGTASSSRIRVALCLRGAMGYGWPDRSLSGEMGPTEMPVAGADI